MTPDDDTPATGPRRRHPDSTSMLMVPEVEIARAVEAAKDQLRGEWQMNIDRKAIDGAIAEAHQARDHSRGAVQTSHRRWMTILAVLGALAVAVAMLWAYTKTNRERIEHLERVQENR